MEKFLTYPNVSHDTVVKRIAKSLLHVAYKVLACTSDASKDLEVRVDSDFEGFLPKKC